MGNGKTYNIPYITVFEKGNQKVTVADRNGIISDNAQLKDLNYYIGNYFSEITDTEIDFVLEPLTIHVYEIKTIRFD